MNGKQKLKKNIVLIILSISMFVFFVFNGTVIAIDSYTDAFGITHTDALALTVETVTLDNKPIIYAALIAFGNLSAETQGHLENEKTLLDDLMTRITELEYEANNLTLEQEADAFRIAHADALILTVETVTTDNRTIVETSLVEFKNLKAEAQSSLENEKVLLDSLLTKIAELEYEANNLILEQETNEFEGTHTDVLDLTVETVEIENRAMVEAALVAFENLSAEAQQHLENEKILLDDLMAKIMSLEFKVTHKEALGLTIDIVTIENRTILRNALTEFEALSEKSQVLLESEKALLNDLIAVIIRLEFEISYARVSSLTIETVSITDRAIVDAALLEFNNLSEETQALFSNEKKLLDALISKIVTLDFDTAHANALALTIEVVEVTDKSIVDAALRAFRDLSADARMLLEAEKTLLDGLMAVIVRLEFVINERDSIITPSFIAAIIMLFISAIAILILSFKNRDLKKHIRQYENYEFPNQGISDLQPLDSPFSSNHTDSIPPVRTGGIQLSQIAHNGETPAPLARPKGGIVLLDKKLPPIIEVEESTENSTFSKHRLIFEIQAVHELKKHISWGQSNSTNKNEQQGLLVGKVIRDSHGGYTGRVERVILSKAQGSAAYIETSHSEWNEMDKELNQLNVGKIETEKYIKVGWWHTHPNMGIFMSGTDRDTQSKYYSKDWQFAVVLNPQGQRWGVFVGADATPSRGAFLK